VISVSIAINGVVVQARSAVNVCKCNCERGGERHLCTYKVDDGTRLKHWRGDGAVKLAKMMLDTINEIKWKNQPRSLSLGRSYGYSLSPLAVNVNTRNL